LRTPGRAPARCRRPRTTWRSSGPGARARRIASAVGYIGTELAKEAPYYAGAFSAALLSDSVSSGDALVFLGGANLGAAAYEYGLARGTRAFLRRGNAPVYASFETDWVPKEYLADYYKVVEPDERQTIAFFVDAIRDSEPDEPVLFFGVGPTLHHVFLAAGKASEIHLGDYLPANLREIERWIERDAEAHDWRPFVRYTLDCEGLASPTGEEVARREETTRAKITRLLEVDVRRADPLGEPDSRPYGTVISAYCADSATDDRGTWETYMGRIAGLVRPGGTLITAALRRSRGYHVGGKMFPSAGVDEHDLRAVLEPCFAREDLMIEVRELAEHGPRGYSSIVLARAHRRRARLAGRATCSARRERPTA
jgi:NNMT/PNMT/TEMT family